MIRFLRESVWPRIPTLRIRSTNRISLDRALARHFSRLPGGTVLDVGAKSAPYRHLIPHERYLTLDIDASREPDIRADIHELEWDGEPFDAVLALEVLEHLRDPATAVERMRRVLRERGVCLLSTRFLYRYHPDPEDHYRFTRDSLEYLFRDWSRVEVAHHGNRLLTLWEMINAGGRTRVLLNLLNPVVARLESGGETRFPLGFVVRAER